MTLKVPHYGSRKLSHREAVALALDIGQGMSKPEAAVKYGVHLRTVYRILARDDDNYRTLGEAKHSPKPRVRKPTPPPKKLKPHGTNAAYKRHLKKKEPACIYCLAAHAQELELWRKGQSPSQLRKKYYEQNDAGGAEEKSA